MYDFFTYRKPTEVDQVALMQRLQRPQGVIDVVLDTDTYNEIDDQYALSYMVLRSDKLRVCGICAAPFYNSRSASPADGMRKSYDEIQKLAGLLRMPRLMDITYAGAEDYLPDETTPRSSDASRAIARLAMEHTPEKPLYVAAIGAITNVASALLECPEIRDRIVIVWLGGNALHWPHTQEFNMMQDIAAARVVLGCGAAVVLVPCMGVVSAFTTTEPELREQLTGKNALCDYLLENTVGYMGGERAKKCWSKQIWDVTAIGWLLDAKFMEDEFITSPMPSYDYHYTQDCRRHMIRYVYHINRDALFADLFETLSKAE